MYLFLLFCIGTESVDEIRRHLGDTRGFSFVQTCDRLPRIMTGVFHELTDAVLNGISLKYILDGEVIEETFNVVVAFVPLSNCYKRPLYCSDALIKHTRNFRCSACLMDGHHRNNNSCSKATIAQELDFLFSNLSVEEMRICHINTPFEIWVNLDETDQPLDVESDLEEDEE